jgi:hypothetical protein
VLVALAPGTRAWAGGKPAIAILGLEVSDNGSGIDPDTTKAAKDLTAALRDRARAGTGPYVPAPGGDKELIDEKLINNCDTEAATCMAAIGTELGAEVLMYGRIERLSQNGQPIYKVWLKVLNVARKQIASSTAETLPVADASGVRLFAHAKAWYGKLVGIITGGNVLVRANIDRGTVLLDDEVKGNLASGTVALSGIAEGRHTLAIEAKDYQRYETAITVHGGETLSHTATLTELSRPLPPTPSKDPISIEGTVSRSKSNLWKPIFYGTAVLDAGLIGFSIFEWNKGNTEAKAINSNVIYSGSDCDGDQAKAGTGLSSVNLMHLNGACKALSRQKLGWIASGVVGVAVIGSFVMAYVRDSGSAEPKTSARPHRKRREFAVTPIVSPEGGGATLRFDW